MIIPGKIRVGGLDFQVIESADIAAEGNKFGSMHTRKQKIFIDPGEPDAMKEQTFFHEVLHAIWWQYGLCTRKDVKDFEEEIIDAMSNGLHQVLKDNNLLK